MIKSLIFLFTVGVFCHSFAEVQRCANIFAPTLQVNSDAKLSSILNPNRNNQLSGERAVIVRTRAAGAVRRPFYRDDIEMVNSNYEKGQWLALDHDKNIIAKSPIFTSYQALEISGTQISTGFNQLMRQIVLDPRTIGSLVLTHNHPSLPGVLPHIFSKPDLNLFGQLIDKFTTDPHFEAINLEFYILYKDPSGVPAMRGLELNYRN